MKKIFPGSRIFFQDKRIEVWEAGKNLRMREKNSGSRFIFQEAGKNLRMRK